MPNPTDRYEPVRCARPQLVLDAVHIHTALRARSEGTLARASSSKLETRCVDALDVGIQLSENSGMASLPFRNFGSWWS